MPDRFHWFQILTHGFGLIVVWLIAIALVLLMVGIMMRGMEDFGEDHRRTWAEGLGFTLMLGLTAAIPIGFMFGGTWLIERGFGLLGWTFPGEYAVAFGVSLFLVLGGIYYTATRNPSVSAPRRDIDITPKRRRKKRSQR